MHKSFLADRLVSFYVSCATQSACQSLNYCIYFLSMKGSSFCLVLAYYVSLLLSHIHCFGHKMLHFDFEREIEGYVMLKLSGDIVLSASF